MAPGRVRISFPRHAPALLDSLNRLRLQGKFCDVAVHAGGRVFAAHGSVLAAASPFFHDKLLLRAGPRLALPPAVDAAAFEGLLELIYCGRLSVAAEALPGHLLVASALQMWHVVERCSQVLRELEGDGRDHGGAAAAQKVGSHEGSVPRNGRGQEGSSAWDGCDGREPICGLDGTIHGVDGSVHGLEGSSASSSLLKATHGHDGSVHGLDGPSVSSSSSKLTRGHSRSIHGLDGSVCGLDGSIHGLDGSSASSSSSKATHGLDMSIHGLDGSTHGLDGSSRAVHSHEGSLTSSSSSWLSRGREASPSSASSRVVHARRGSLLTWNIRDGDESVHGLDGSVHGLDGSSRAIHGPDGSLPSSSSSSRTIRGREGSSSLLSGTVRVREESTLLWSVSDGDESIHGQDGALPSSSSSSKAIQGREGSPSSSKAIQGREGSPSSSSRTVHGPNRSSRANRSGERSSSSSSSWTLRGGTVAPRLNRGGERASSSSSSLRGSLSTEGTIHGGSGTVHGDTRNTHGDNGTIHSDIGTIHSDIRTIRVGDDIRNTHGDSGTIHVIHGDSGSIHGDIGTIHGDIKTIHVGDGDIHDDIVTIHDDIRTIHSDIRTIHGDIRTIHVGDEDIHDDIGTIHGDMGTIHGDIHTDIVTIHADNDPSSSSSSSWPTRAPTEELLQLRTDPPGEILKIRLEDDNDDEGAAWTVPDAAAPATPPDPPAVFYIKPDPDACAAAAPPSARPAWTPVDLHGNELPRRGGPAVHAPVRAGAAPADGKRFGCACGKRFAARPKRDRHILLTLSLRPFACGRCHKRFKLKHHLREHLKTHEGGRGRRGRGAATGGDGRGAAWGGVEGYGEGMGV